MRDEPRQKLLELIVEYGRSLCDDPRRCEALLKDHCGNYKQEVFVLISALKNRVAEDLLKNSASVPYAIVLARLNQRLQDELAMTAEAARWAVESWALAMGVIAQPLPMVEPTAAPSLASPPCVAETLLADRYQDNGDGTVTDVQTGLQWMRFSLGQEWKDGTCVGEARRYTCQEALNAADALNNQSSYAGYRDWRLPTSLELITLVYSSGGQPTIYQPAFPNTPAWGYWSYPNIFDFAPAPIEGYVDFRNGQGVAILGKSNFHHGHFYHVRLVRGGQ